MSASEERDKHQAESRRVDASETSWRVSCSGALDRDLTATATLPLSLCSFSVLALVTAAAQYFIVSKRFSHTLLALFLGLGHLYCIDCHVWGFRHRNARCSASI